MSWFLRKSDETVYGPVDLPTLCRWAADGRVLPEDGVSQDQASWTPAPQLAELAMDWIIELSNGVRYGPLHLMAMAELVRDGTARGGETLLQQSTGESVELAERLLPALAEQSASLQAALDAQAASAAAAHRQDVAAERDAQAAAEKKLNVRIRELTDLEQKLRARAEAAEGRVRELERRAAAPLPAIKVGNGEMDAQTLLQSYNDLSRNYESLLEQIRAKERELNKTVADRDHAEKDTHARVAQMEEATERERAESAHLRERLAQLEKTHAEIVHAYRDLNDRYIRLRQQAEGPPPVAPGPRPSAKSAPEKPRVRLV